MIYPKNLQFISFGKAFRQPLNFNHIPTSILKISFSRYTNVIVPEALNDFNKLQVIRIGISTQHLLAILNRFPSLHALIIDGTDNKDYTLPNQLTTLIFGFHYKSRFPQYYSGKKFEDMDNIDGKDVSKTLPNIKGLLVNNRKFKNENGKLKFEEFITRKDENEEETIN